MRELETRVTTGRARACVEAVGRSREACSQNTPLIHQVFVSPASCAKNVFFSPSYTRIPGALIHMLFDTFQSVKFRLYTVYTGLTKTTTIKLYIYKGVCS
jgi:hypothetical protein